MNFVRKRLPNYWVARLYEFWDVEFKLLVGVEEPIEDEDVVGISSIKNGYIS